MNSIEQMRWAKELIEEKSGGAFELVAGNIRGDLFLRCSDNARVGLYLTMQPNMKSGRYDCQFQGYTRISSGYYDASEMQRLADEYQMVASLQKELEAAHISLSPENVAAFSAELLSKEEQHTIAPQMGRIHNENYRNQGQHCRGWQYHSAARCAGEHEHGYRRHGASGLLVPPPHKGH